MKTIVKRLARDEKGASLVLVLILLLISGLIIGPLLSYMGTGLITGEVYERRTDELYAADAGVEDAIWKIQHGETPVCPADPEWSYTIADVNGKSLQISIEYLDGGTYKINSIAITDDGGGTAALTGTEIEAYITGESIDYSGLLDNILTSQGDLDWKNKVNLVYPEENGPVANYTGLWPTPEDLAQFYWEDVKDEESYDSDTIDLEGEDDWRGPFYRDGELDILNSSNTPATLTLTGTVYITGDTLIGQNGKDMTLDLNGQTIFVASDSSDALIMGGKCTVVGPGCIIAVGDVYFAPKGDVGGNEEPVFILSVSGTTILQPSGDFYGAIAGSVEVNVKSGEGPIITYPPGGFEEGGINFPGFVEPTQLVYSIESWEVIPLWRE